MPAFIPIAPVIESRSLKKQRQSEKNATRNVPFRRIKEETIEINHDALKDNSFWSATGGHEWGQKANEVLSAVRGKGFKHEKTKKKKGTYRGGNIDSGAVHSFKFPD